MIGLWLQLRHGNSADGPWLCGARGLVDAFYAPVMTRFRSYGVELPTALQATAKALFDDEDFREWESRPMTDILPDVDDVYPGA